MIERIYIKEYVSFESVDIHCTKGLVVFTGPSGAGKSLLIGALLALFGFKPVEAKMSEVVISDRLDLEEYGILSEDEVVVRALKKEKARYFINNQTVSKRLLRQIFASKIAYLNQKDWNFFASHNILVMVDEFIENEEFLHAKKEFEALYERYENITKQLQELEEKEKKQDELKEFLEFEIEKIESIAPKIGEYEELLKIKKELSKKEKIAQTIQKAEGIFEYEDVVQEALMLCNKESAFFDEAMNELKEILYSEMERLRELEEMDIEEILDRIEKLSSLQRRYGSIEEALRALAAKKAELAKIERLEYDKERLYQEKEAALAKLHMLAALMSEARKEGAKRLEEQVNRYVKALKLGSVQIVHQKAQLTKEGRDSFVVQLGGVEFKRISSGEYNRLRLGFMAARKRKQSGVLIVDEIDANISGEESMAVAKILKELAGNYQIFAISHQAQLASVADQHFLVTKEGAKSSVQELDTHKRAEEIARIISGEQISEEARDFAKKMLKEAS